MVYCSGSFEGSSDMNECMKEELWYKWVNKLYCLHLQAFVDVKEIESRVDESLSCDSFIVSYRGAGTGLPMLGLNIWVVLVVLYVAGLQYYTQGCWSFAL